MAYLFASFLLKYESLLNIKYLVMQVSSTERDLVGMQKKVSSSQNCALCRPSDPQTHSILHSLLQKFIFKKNEGLSTQPAKQCDKFQIVNFHKLLSTIFAKKYNHFKATFSCPHKELKTYFCSVIGCTEAQLDQISDKITWQRAKYNYHIDVLNQQIRSFPRIMNPPGKKVPKQLKKQPTNKEISSNEQKKNKAQKEKELEGVRIEPKIENREEEMQKMYMALEKGPMENNKMPPYISQPTSNQLNFNMNMGSFACFNPMNLFWTYQFQSNEQFNTSSLAKNHERNQ